MQHIGLIGYITITAIEDNDFARNDVALHYTAVLNLFDSFLANLYVQKFNKPCRCTQRLSAFLAGSFQYTTANLYIPNWCQEILIIFLVKLST